jgi:hypothetical protein
MQLRNPAQHCALHAHLLLCAAGEVPRLACGLGASGYPIDVRAGSPPITAPGSGPDHEVLRCRGDRSLAAPPKANPGRMAAAGGKVVADAADTVVLAPACAALVSIA